MSWGSKEKINNDSRWPDDKKDQRTDDKDSSSNDQKQFGSDRQRKRSTGSQNQEFDQFKCKFYKSLGDESSVERREFEIRGPISFKDFCDIIKRKFKLIEPIFEHYKLFALMRNGERWTITEQDEFTRIYEDHDLDLNFIIEKKQWKLLKTKLGNSKKRMMSLFS